MAKERTQDHTFHRTLDMIAEGSPVHDGYHDVIFKSGSGQHGPEQKPSQEFPEYGMEFQNDSVCLDFVSSVSHASIDPDLLRSVGRSYLLETHPRVLQKGDVRGVISEIAFNLALEDLIARDKRIVRPDDEIIKGDHRLERRHNELAGYTYYQLFTNEKGKNSWRIITEYDGIVFFSDASETYKPLVIEVKMQTTSWSNRGVQTAMRPGVVERKLMPLLNFFDGPLAYGVVMSPERATDRSPLQTHFKNSGGLVIPHPLTNEQIDSYVEELIVPKENSRYTP